MAAAAPTDQGPNVADRTIELHVGAESEKRSLFVHEPLIRASSDYFNAALKEAWTKSSPPILIIRDLNADEVYIYVQWLYTRKIYAKTTDNEGKPWYDQLMQLYVLGERVLSDAFQDCVMDAIVALNRVHWGAKNHNWFPFGINVTVIYEGTSKPSPARQLLVDMHAVYGLPEWLDNDQDGSWRAHEDFKQDLVKELLRQRGVKAASKKYNSDSTGVLCAYHKHGSDKPCTAKQA